MNVDRDSAMSETRDARPRSTARYAEDELHPSTTDYIAHFNQVVGNYAEAVLTGRGSDRHKRAARSLDLLMREYADAIWLWDFLANLCCRQIEEADDWHAKAAELSDQYPPLASALTQFVAMLETR